MEQNIWLINKTDSTIEICIKELRKWFIFDTKMPVSLSRDIALKYVSQYQGLSICDNPMDYFEKRPLRQLVVRDAGIGDLLLLEPVLRTMKEKGNCTLDVLTRYPEVYENHPSIDKVIFQKEKQNITAADMSNYDAWEDLRSYSETSPNRATTHRTDIYNEKFGFKIEDKEPRLFFNKKEKCKLKKKSKLKYVGIQLDASHSFRKFFKKKELIQLLASNGLGVVILGDDKYCDDIPRHRNIIDMQGKTTIREAINVIKELDYMIAVDSGLMHIALTLHIPTVCIFSIITPRLRLAYYTGEHRVIIKPDLQCVGCGNWHMQSCKYESGNEFIPPCMDLDVNRIYNTMMEMDDKKARVIKLPEIKKVNINLLPEKKLTMPIICQNEEKNLPRFIDNVIKHPSIGRVIAIDGGSKDNTVKILEKAGVEVYVHPYIKGYHEQQAMQRNISCSYIKDGDNIIIMDLDECFSKELSDYLPVLANSNDNYGHVSRRTFEYYKDITDPNKQIKDYPDYQPRFYKWDRKFKFVGGAHHVTLNCPEPVRIDKDIIHFECEGKSREAIEKQWAGMMAGVKKYV